MGHARTVQHIRPVQKISKIVKSQNVIIFNTFRKMASVSNVMIILNPQMIKEAVN